MAKPDLDRGSKAFARRSKRYSIFSLAKHAGSYHQEWQQAWRHAEPKTTYDAVIIGGGGHGLATAYYLANIYGITNIAVIEYEPVPKSFTVPESGLVEVNAT